MSRRRKPTPQSVYIWDQLDRFQEAYFAARREGREGRTEWERLYQYTIACQESASVDVDDVGAVLSWGWVMEMTAGNYPENATYAELLRLLDSTYPPSGQEALRAERESRS